MKRLISFCASLAFLLGMSTAGNAAVVITSSFDLMTLSNVESPVFNDFKYTTLSPPGGWFEGDSFEDYWYFDVPSPAVGGVSTSEVSFGIGGGLLQNISGFQIDVFSCIAGQGDCTDRMGDLGPGGLATDFLHVAGIFTPSPGPGGDVINFVLSGLSTTLVYALEIKGTPNGLIGGNYDGSVVLVPLPPAAVLFLSALAGLAGFSRIRRRKAVA